MDAIGATTPGRGDGGLFGSRFLAGFECSTHRRSDGRRLDLVEATAHDRFARADYAAVAALGLRAARDGARWHRIDGRGGFYDWTSLVPMLRAARAAHVTVIWDLCHYGWPDGLDIWSARFVERFARFAGALARVHTGESDAPGCYCPINEISFWAWAGGDVALFFPLARRRGDELKRQLVRATIAAIDAIREVDPHARFVAAEPLIHVAAHEPAMRADAERARLAQFEACDMLCGRRSPSLGGAPKYLDIVGVNFYPTNQWFYGASTIATDDAAFRPLRFLLAEVAARYARPMFIAETGAEGAARVPWLRYVVDEVDAAARAGVATEGICLYPVLDYPGWSDDRHCETGLLGHADEDGLRAVYAPLASEIERHSAPHRDCAA